MSKCVKCSSPDNICKQQLRWAPRTGCSPHWQSRRWNTRSYTLLRNAHVLSTDIIKSLVTLTSGWKRLEKSDAACYRQSEIYQWCICHTQRRAQTQASATAQHSLFLRSETEWRQQPCILCAVKQPRPTTQPTTCKQLCDFTYSKYSSKKELAEANPYLEIWGFPFLKFSLIVLASYLAFICPQSCYAAHLIWLLHNKSLAGSAEEIWQHFSKYLTTLFSICHSHSTNSSLQQFSISSRVKNWNYFHLS